ncbi:MAG: SRPBCC family protein [Planctomycetota bacterium]|jgi:hypothetical protein
MATARKTARKQPAAKKKVVKEKAAARRKTTPKKKAAPKNKTAAQRGKISDDAVKSATGRSWAQWFAALDKAGCKGKDHKAIVAAVGKVSSKTSGWWRQMVTVEYERARGLRKLHEKAGGFAVGASRTLPVPIGKLYKAWSDDRTRERWLADTDIVIRKATREKSMRITWVDGKSSVNVYFWDKGPGKSQVTIDHEKLPSQRDVKRLKLYWSDNLDALKALLSG